MSKGSEQREAPVRFDEAGGVLTVTLERDSAINAVTAPMLRTIERELTDRAANEELRLVVLRGAGRGFCSGADLGGESGSQDPDLAVLEAGNAVVTAILDYPVPVVAVVHGPVAGIGVSLALACDLVLARDDAYFLLAFTRIGLMPDGGATELVAASIGRARAMRMALLAEKLPAGEALEAGLVSHVFSEREFDAGVADLLTALAAGPTRAYRATRQAINAATLPGIADAFAREHAGQGALLSSADFAEGVTAFRERRTARFSGA